MASGRPDYWNAVVPGKAVIAAGQSDWLVSGGDYVDPAETKILIEYTVPVGYRVNITTVLVSSYSPHSNTFYLIINDTSYWRMQFESELIIPFGSVGSVILEAGDVLKGQIHNYDGKKYIFFVNFTGFEEQIL